MYKVQGNKLYKIVTYIILVQFKHIPSLSKTRNKVNLGILDNCKFWIIIEFVDDYCKYRKFYGNFSFLYFGKRWVFF